MSKLFYKSEDHSENYLASIVKIDNLTKHPFADRLQIFTYLGKKLITDLKAQVGDIVIYFPVECAINADFLKENNSYRDKNLNKDITKAGFFEENGRVKALRLQKVPSEGLIMPLSSLEVFSGVLSEKEIESLLDVQFDMVGDLQLCKKYIIKNIQQQGAGNKDKKINNKMADLLLNDHFLFHNSTAHFDKVLHSFNPEDVVSITYKDHGSSCILSNPLIKRKLSWFEKILTKFGVKIPDTEYGHVYSSGKPKSKLPKAILSSSSKKEKNLYTNKNGDFYKANIWERAFNDHKHILYNGLSIYGELIGYDATGKGIQGQYDYGCEVGNYKFTVYRINSVSSDGKVFEYSWQQIKEFCVLNGLEHVTELYYGKLGDLFPDLDVNNHWHENFLEKLKENFLEKDCFKCKNPVPAEGIVVRKDGNFSFFEVFKLKAFRFLEHESKQLDSGILDIESAEAGEN